MKKRPAIFLDRDGTLIEDIGYIKYELDIIFYENTFKALEKLQEEFLLFIVTNQSGIGRGVLTKKQVENVNAYLVDCLKARGIVIYDVYYCPHITENKCKCKKPGPYFLHQAADKYYIDLNRSFMIGDHPEDVYCAENAGATGIYVLTGHGAKHVHEFTKKPIIRENIYDATKYILSRPSLYT